MRRSGSVCDNSCQASKPLVNRKSIAFWNQDRITNSKQSKTPGSSSTKTTLRGSLGRSEFTFRILINVWDAYVNDLTALKRQGWMDPFLLAKSPRRYLSLQTERKNHLMPSVRLHSLER